MGRIDSILAEAARLNDDFGRRQEFLESESYRMMRHPTLGGQLIARLCATDDEALQEQLGELLHNLLNTVRMVRESNLKRGDEFLNALTDAVGLAAGQGRIASAQRMLLASTWTRNGLQPPVSLEMTSDDIDILALQGATPPGLAQAEAGANQAIGKLLEEMIETVNGDPFMLYLALIEILPTMPMEIRGHLVAWSAAGPEAFHAKLACFWLFNPDAQLRLAAAQGLADKAAAGKLPADIAGKMVMLRSWMPDDGARATVDQVLKAIMRTGMAAASAVKLWEAHWTAVTLQDGGGAQSVVVALRSGRSRKTALLLLKQGYGVKDVCVVPAESASEQKEFIKHLKTEMNCFGVPLPWVENSLAMSIAEGLAAGHRPHPGLVEAAELCGFANLRPKAVTTKELVDSLPAAKLIRGLEARGRTSLINASESWWQRHEVVSSWFEQNDAAHDILEAKGVRDPSTSVLWKWLRTRRDFWALHFARGADILSAAGHPDANSFTAVAAAVAEGRDMKKIPIMVHIHDSTVQMWLNDDPNGDDEDMREEPPEEEYEVERPGEPRNLIEDVGATTDRDRRLPDGDRPRPEPDF